MDLTDLMVKSYNLSLVLLSIIVVMLSAYTSLDLSGHAKNYAGQSSRKYWLAGSGIAMGLGIWAMHFIGMLAMRQPFPITYHLFITILSLILAIISSFIAIFLVSRNRISANRFIAAGVVMGSGIAAMHYVGMSAIESPYHLHYRLVPFAGSILVAIGVSYFALYVTFRLQNQSTNTFAIHWKIYGAMLLGLAVTGMHYTAMYATHFLNADKAWTNQMNSYLLVPELFQLTLQPGVLAICIGITVTILVIFLLIGAYIDRKLAIEAAQLTAMQFKTLFNNNPDMICTFGSKGQLLNVNASVYEMIGYTVSELLYYPKVAERLFQSFFEESEWDSYLQQDETRQQEISMVHKDGAVVELYVTTIPMKVRKRIIGVMAIAKNITDRKRDEELLRRSDKLNIAGHLAAGVAHEIRNPLTAIKGFIQLSRSGQLKSDFHNVILAEIDQIERIITEFLLLAKPQSSNFHRTGLQPLTEHVLTLVQAQANMSNVEVAAEFGTDIPDIYGDENKLKQVFVNLMKNAIESMNDGGTVTLKVERKGDLDVMVRIEDEGVGISEELRKKLGEPFYSTKEKGTGLGLMVSFKIISEHHGHIDFQHAKGGGTVVEVTLPVLPPVNELEGTDNLHKEGAGSR